MSVNHKILPSFAVGEISPGLYSRVDTEKYNAGLKTARNVCVLPQGGVRNRPGTYYAAAAGDSTNPVRVVPFIYSTGQAYVIEIGQEYIRFFYNHAPVLSSYTGTAPAWTYTPPTSYYIGNYVIYNNQLWLCISHDVSSQYNFPGSDPTKWVLVNPIQIAIPYLAAELFDLKFVQSADYLYIFHPLHAPQTLVRNSNDSWTLSPVPFINGPFMLSNIDIGKTLTSNSATPAYNVAFTIGEMSPGAPPYPGSIFDYVRMQTTTAHGLATGATVKIAAITNVAFTSLNGNIYSVEVVDTTHFYLCYLATQNRILISSFGPVTLGAGTVSKIGPSTITANFPLFDPLHVGALFQMTETIAAQSVTASTGGSADTGSIKCGTTWRVISTGTWAGTITVKMSTDGGTTWNTLQTLTSAGNGGTILSSNYDTSGLTGTSQCLIKVSMAATYGTVTVTAQGDTFDWNGIIQITAVAGPTSATANILSQVGVGIGLASTNPVVQWSEGSWSDYRGWPTVATFFQDRLAIASTLSEPETIWFSQIGSYANFGVSFPLVDSDAISLVLNSRTINSIRNLSPLSSLVVNTSDSDFSISPTNGVLTPTGIDQECHGHRGTSTVTSLIVGNELILIQPMNSVVRNLIYQFSVGGYMGDNISVISQHLFSGYSIIEMAYQQEPDSLVWAVRSDGVLLCMSYMREQEIIAWTHHDTQGGLFESVCCIPNATLGINEVWVVVNRSGTRYIERMAKRDMGTNTKDYMMLDCAVTHAGAATVTVTGLSHLNGQTVNALADGNVVTGLVVAGGAVTLPVAAAVAHVGLPYVSDIETLPIEQQNRDGSSQGRKSAIAKTTLRVWNSRGGYYRITSQGCVAPDSTTATGFDELRQREPGDDMSIAIPLQTRDFLVNLNGGYDFRTSIFIRQVDPLPLCVTAIIPQISQAGN